MVNAGVPLVTRYGRTMVSRMGLSILREIGEVENAVSTFEDYERKVVEIALRRHAQPDRIFSTRVGSLFNQALQGLVKPEPEASLVSSVAVVTRPSLQLTRHKLMDEARAGATIAGFTVRSDADLHFQQVRALLLGRQPIHAGYWGFMRDEDLTTCGVSGPELENLVLSQGNDRDVLMFNPFWDVTAFHLNPFFLAEKVSTGVLEAAQTFTDSLHLDVRLRNWVSCSDTFLLDLNFVAKRRIWLDWLEMADRLLRSKNPKVMKHRQMLYMLSGNFLLMTNKLTVHAVDPFTLPALILHPEEMLESAVACDALKASYLRSGHNRYLEQHRRLVDNAIKDAN